MPNQYVNKVVKSDGTTLLDLSQDTVTLASHIMAGYVGHLANGEQVTGTGQGGPSATSHTIYFEFSDGTNTTLTGYWDSSFISDAILASTPSTYGQKTVDSASLDGVTWYERPTETWETIFNDVLYVNPGNPYGGMWAGDLGDVAITIGSEWRVTFDNGTPYTMTATANGIYDAPHNTIIGNPMYIGGTNDGSAVPFCFEQNPWGAWTGGTDTSIAQETNHAVKIERLVTA